MIISRILCFDIKYRHKKGKIAIQQVVSRHPLAPTSSVSQEKVDCITVNCEPVKAAIDDLIQRLFDLLLVSLKKSIQGTDTQHSGASAVSARNMNSSNTVVATCVAFVHMRKRQRYVYDCMSARGESLWPTRFLSVCSSVLTHFCICSCFLRVPSSVGRSHSGNRHFCDGVDGHAVGSSGEHGGDWRRQRQVQPHRVAQI